ncbi:hypothetical protein FB451DRAFT_209937 [Mycena latifolia]|nr:hypothetical protein FB451DRAFT_209937 [Mycena latifolia]
MTTTPTSPIGTGRPTTSCTLSLVPRSLLKVLAIHKTWANCLTSRIMGSVIVPRGLLKVHWTSANCKSRFIVPSLCMMLYTTVYVLPCRNCPPQLNLFRAPSLILSFLCILFLVPGPHVIYSSGPTPSCAPS